ncbi:MAG: maleylpyruvate isomerase family mycothiol-dependent enzyme, partial [Chloroflexota bacterium]
GELIKHVGYSHRWAGEMVRVRSDKFISFRDVPMGLPADRADYAEWLTAGREPLLGLLRAAEPDAPMWAWGADQHVRFWGRRQLFETVVHHADARLALGRSPGIDAAVAVEGVDEFLENLPYAAAFAPNVKELRGNGESLHFHCTDAEGEWMIQLNPDGFSWEHGHGKGSVAVRGAAADLLLLTYRRLKLNDARFQRFGDEGVLASWLANAHI